MELFTKLNNYIHNPKVFLRVVLNHLGPYIKDDATFLKLKWRISDMQYSLNLENPKSFCEKLQWLKLHDRKPIYTTMVDKVEAKKYVASIIGEEYIIPTIAVWNSADEIDWDALPNQFVMKCSHDSGGIVICKDKAKLDRNKAYQTMKKGLKRRYFWQNREWPYKDVTPRIIVEKYMIDESGIELKDYKFFCFDGQVKAVQLDFDRFESHKRNVYDSSWNLMDLQIQFPKSPYRFFPKPVNFEKMLSLASILSKGHPHLRVDFYNIGGKIYFGELTFFHGSGLEVFTPVEWDYKFGEWIKLPTKELL